VNESPASRVDDDYKAKAYNYMLTDLKTGKERNKQLLYDNVKRFPKLTKSSFQRYIESQRNPNSKMKMREINDAVLLRFREMHDQCAIIHDRTLRLWAIQAKKVVDPDNNFSFKASQSWARCLSVSIELLAVRSLIV